MSSSDQLAQLRDTLKALENCPEPSQVPVGGEVDKKAVVERYETLKETYLQRRQLTLFFQHVRTFDGSSFQVPTEMDGEALRERQNAVIQRMQGLGEELERVQEVSTSTYATVQAHRQELTHMIQEMQAQDVGADQDDMDNTDVSSEQVATVHGDTLTLRQREATLQAQLVAARREQEQLKAGLDQEKENASRLLVESGRSGEPTDSDTIERVQTDMEAMQTQIDEMQEIRSFYDNLRALLEDLGGKKVQSVEAVENNDQEQLRMTVKLMDKYDVEVGLQMEPSKRAGQPDTFAVVRADLLSSPLIQRDSIQLRIPDLQDLVHIAQQVAPRDSLRTVLSEACWRFHVFEHRLSELVALQQHCRVQVCELSTISSSQSFGGHDQQVVCQLDGLSLVLRLTPDCPMVPGSVYLDQVVGTGADSIQRALTDQRFSQPLALVKAVQDQMKTL